MKFFTGKNWTKVVVLVVCCVGIRLDASVWQPSINSEFNSNDRSQKARKGAIQKLLQEEAGAANVSSPRNFAPIVVIGSGVAGLSAAIQTSLEKQHTVVIRGTNPGGQLLGAAFVENMPGTAPDKGYKIVESLEERAHEVGVQFLDGAVERIEPIELTYADATTVGWAKVTMFKLTLSEKRVIYALTVIIATGATPRYLGVAGEEQYKNKGVYTCAVCDGRRAIKKRVVVVGGGDSSIEEVMHLASHTDHITLLVRKDQMRASTSRQAKLAQYPQVTTLYHTEVLEICGDGQNLTGVRMRDTHTGTESVIPADCVFLAIGHTPHSAPFSQLVECDELGHIKLLGRSQATSCPGIFAIGDVADPVYRKAESAQGDACKAALDVTRYLQNASFGYQALTTFEPFLVREA